VGWRTWRKLSVTSGLVLLQNLAPLLSYAYTGDETDCVLCGGKRSATLCRTDRRWKPLETRVCLDCGLMRTQPMPSEAELADYYRHDYRLDYQFTRSPGRAHRCRARREASVRAEHLRYLLRPGTTVLDMGCGSGEFVHLATTLGCRARGADPGCAYLEHARDRPGVAVDPGGWRDLAYEDGSFEVITLNHVLEHLREPVAALTRIRRWLTPGGRVFIAVPDMRTNDQPSFERFHFAHVHGFIPQTLEATAAAAGLVPETGGRLETTTAVFRQANEADRSIAIVDPARAERLLESYPDDSVARYILGGGWVRDVGQRALGWWRDSRGDRGRKQKRRG